MPTLKRNIATTAATDSSSAQTFTLVSTGASNDNGRSRAPAAPRAKIVWMANQIARLRIDADHRRRDRRQRAGQRLVAAQRLDEGRAEEDPEEARRERHPGGEQAAERAGEQRRQRARVAEGAP